MAVSLARALGAALRDAHAHAAAAGADPLRLELPPEQTDADQLEPRAAAVLGSLYLLSELEQAAVVPCAELLAAERWSLSVRDERTVAALEQFAGRMRGRPAAQLRGALYERLFGTPAVQAAPTGVSLPGSAAPPNEVFDELLAGYCESLVQYDARRTGVGRAGLRLAGDRLRANLTPRQYGNTFLVAEPLIDQLRDAIALLAQPGIGSLFGVRGVWAVVRAMQGEAGADLGRHVDRGRSGQAVVSSTGYPPVPDLVDSALVLAAQTWLVATGFDGTGAAEVGGAAR